jgi:hypothetical protein
MLTVLLLCPAEDDVGETGDCLVQPQVMMKLKIL